MIKLLFYILIISYVNYSYGCGLSIPESYVPTFLNPPVVGHYQKCEDKPLEKCHCIDVVNPYYSDLVDNIVLDYIRKDNVQSCTLLENTEGLPEFNQYQDCDDKFALLSCVEGVAINNYDLMEVYCAVDVMKIDGKKLAENPSKKAQYLADKAQEKASEEAAEAARLQAVEALKSADIVNATTVSKLRAIVELLIKARK